MAARGKNVAFGALGIALLALTLSAPASAQGIFESIFGGLRRAIEAPAPAPALSALSEPFTGLANAIGGQQHIRSENGRASAFCVRTCDGHYFPVQAHAGLSTAQSCHAFCPASETRIYAGGNIDYAVAGDGSRYADLPNAFAYRKQLAPGCTCNGRDQFGLARMDVNNDPTLRHGDVVATKNGLMAFAGAKNNVADFTPIDNYRGLSQAARGKLSSVKIMPD